VPTDHVSGVRCMVMRGGTSKGLYLAREDLPGDPERRDDLLLRLMGSPDDRQIDGLGGGHPLTSKVAVVAPATDDDADVEYLFLQLGVDQALVTDRQNCGNLLAGVGPFAMERGWVQPNGDPSTVRIRMVNSGGIAVARFPTADGLPRYEGETAISGTPGTAAAISLSFRDIAGGSCGSLLPTGNVQDVLAGVPVTCVDNGMPVVTIRATDLGIDGAETCRELEKNHRLRELLERIRTEAGPAMHLGDVTEITVPKLTIVSPPRGEGHVTTRTFIPHRCHTSIGVLGAVSVATACLLPGSVGSDVLRTGADPSLVTLEHPTGTFTAAVTLTTGSDGNPTIEEAGIIRTARKLMDGTAFPRP
jgi:4-oxalomesaconate tautomerase